MKAVLVRWRDAHNVNTDNWMDADDIDDDDECVVESVGYLHSMGEKHVTILQSNNSASPAPHRAVFRIPVGNVVEMVELGVVPHV